MHGYGSKDGENLYYNFVKIWGKWWLAMSNSKYKNVMTTVDGINFASKKEANRYAELLLLQKAKQIIGLEVHVPFVLQEGFTAAASKDRIAPIRYIADFYYYDIANHAKVIEDVKGGNVRTKDFNLKWKMMKKKYPEPEYMYLIT